MVEFCLSEIFLDTWSQDEVFFGSKVESCFMLIRVEEESVVLMEEVVQDLLI